MTLLAQVSQVPTKSVIDWRVVPLKLLVMGVIVCSAYQINLVLCMNAQTMQRAEPNVWHVLMVQGIMFLDRRRQGVRAALGLKWTKALCLASLVRRACSRQSAALKHILKLDSHYQRAVTQTISASSVPLVRIRTKLVPVSAKCVLSVSFVQEKEAYELKHVRI